MTTHWLMVVVLMVVALVHTQSRVDNEKPTPSEMIKTPNLIVEDLPIFEKGEFNETTIRLEKRHPSAPPEPLLIATPQKAGSYPILLFIHGAFLGNDAYSQLLQHIASHGVVVVTPQLLWFFIIPSQADEIEMAASVANWLPSKLQDVLPDGVQGDLDRFAVSGHSRGGKSAFALALGISKTKLTLKISALIGVDPVAGRSRDSRTEPHILTYVPDSFNLSIPVTIIGAGLGNDSYFFFPPCAPNYVNHQEFFNECKRGSHFVISKYGHMQMLNDNVGLLPYLCLSGDSPNDVMRRTLGGIMVAFLDAYFRGNGTQYVALMDNPSLAPTELYVENKGNSGLARNYARFSAYAK